MNMLINSVYTWYLRRRLSEIENFKKYPIETQNKCFHYLIEKGKNTEWGKRYNYQNIRNYEDYKEVVPVSEYEDLQDYIQRIMQGEKNVLWPGEIKWMAKSSGTTSSRSKFIPITKDSLHNCHYKAGKDIFAIYCDICPENRIFQGKTLSMGGSHQISFENKSIRYGDLSAILMQNLPFWAELKRTPQLSVALMDEWEEKIEKMAEETSRENVTSIAGVPSWTLLLLRKILEITGKKDISEVWPNLELFIHGGVSFTQYRDQFKAIIKNSKMNYIEAYNASEGFFSIQDRLNADDMLLMLDYGIFFEFVPLEELGKKYPNSLTLKDVEKDKNYAIVISTNGGLWRYLIGDTIRFTSLYPFRIKITGRTRCFINAFGEELIVENAEKAIAYACEKTDAVVTEFTAAPVYYSERSAGAHEWLIEFEKEPVDINLFAKELDFYLKKINSDYEAKRYKNLALDFPIIRVLKPGTFYEWMKQKGKLGGQNKVPRLSNDRKYVEELMNIKI